MTSQPELRQKIIQMLWEKQWENSPWRDKMHLMRPDSLGDYGEFADKLISTITLSNSEHAARLTDSLAVSRPQGNTP